MKEAFAMEMRLTDYPAYWAYHITQHRRAGNRALHYIGSVCLVAFVTMAIVFGIWTPVLAALAEARCSLVLPSKVRPQPAAQQGAAADSPARFNRPVIVFGINLGRLGDRRRPVPRG